MHQQILISLSGGVAPPGAIPSFVAAGPISGNTGSVSLQVPVGHAVGEFMVAHVQTSNQDPGAVSGWTDYPLVGVGTAGASGSTGLKVYTKFVASTSEPNLVVPSSGNHNIGRIYTFSGVNASTPVDVVSSAVTGNTSPNTLPGLTTTGPNRLILFLTSDGQDNSSARYSAWTNTTLGTVTERGDGGGTSGTGGSLGAGTGGLAAAGTVVNGSVVNGFPSANYVSITFALSPT